MRRSCYYRLISIAPGPSRENVINIGVAVASEKGVAVRFLSLEQLKKRVSHFDTDMIHTWGTGLEKAIEQRHRGLRLPVGRRLDPNKDIFVRWSNPYSSIQFSSPMNCSYQDPQTAAEKLHQELIVNQDVFEPM